MADDKTSPATLTEKTRTRSPSNPNFGLEEAIRRLGILYDGIHDRRVGMEAAASILGTNIKSSAFQQGISTLKQFGLLEDEGLGKQRQVWISDNGKDILIRDEDSPERAQCLKMAAVSPAIHRELWDKYEGHLPPSDSPIRVYLLRERDVKFHPDHVDGFISQFRSSIAFAGVTANDIIPAAHESSQVTQSAPRVAWGGSNMQPPKTSTVQPPSPAPPLWGSHAPTGATMRELPIMLPRSLSVAVLKVPIPMSEADYKSMMTMLTDMKDSMTGVADQK